MRKHPGRIALIGMRGSGKSTLGRLLSDSLGLPFVDCDMELESRLGLPIRDMFSQKGEAWFRDQESACLADLVQGDRWVLACGGGVVLREGNRRNLRDRGIVIWLDAQPKILADRVTSDPWSVSGRPPLIASEAENARTQQQGAQVPDRPVDVVRAELEKVLSDRKNLYENTAHFRFPTNEGSPNAWVGQLVMELDKFRPELEGI